MPTSLRQPGIPKRILMPMNYPDSGHWALKVEEHIARAGLDEVRVHRFEMQAQEKSDHFRRQARLPQGVRSDVGHGRQVGEIHGAARNILDRLRHAGRELEDDRLSDLVAEVFREGGEAPVHPGNFRCRHLSSWHAAPNLAGREVVKTTKLAALESCLSRRLAGPKQLSTDFWNT